MKNEMLCAQFQILFIVSTACYWLCKAIHFFFLNIQVRKAFDLYCFGISLGSGQRFHFLGNNHYWNKIIIVSRRNRCGERVCVSPIILIITLLHCIQKQ